MNDNAKQWLRAAAIRAAKTAAQAAIGIIVSICAGSSETERETPERGSASGSNAGLFSRNAATTAAFSALRSVQVE